MDKTDVKTYDSPSYGATVEYSHYNRYAMYNRFNCMNQTDVRVSEYTQGTFIIDMIDPDENASIWRSVTQSKLKEETIRDQAALDSAAVRVLAAFPAAGQQKLGQSGSVTAQVPEASRSGAPHPLISELNPVWYS